MKSNAIRATVGAISLLTVAACSAKSSAPATTTTIPTITVSPGISPAPTTSRTTVAPTVAASQQWVTYHADNARLGVAGEEPSLDPIHLAWRASLDGSPVYGQPLVADGRVLVATEDDDVYGLDPSTGKVVWQVNIGQPLRNVASSDQAGCGDIDPLGITSTPVVDPTTETLYVVGEVSSGGSQPVHHELVGLDVATGKRTFTADVDPALPTGENAVHLLQRAALLVANGRVYVAYGGQYGDCGSYHGWVVGVPLDGSAQTSFDVTPQSSGGAIWQGGGGPSVDASGNLYVSTGNPNSGGPDPWAEAVLKLSPALASPPEASFQDTHATGDLDLATGDVLVLPDGDVFAVGKTDIPFLLSQNSLSPVGDLTGRVCGSDPDGGGAFDESTGSIYLPCQNGGIDQVNLSDGEVGTLTEKVNGPPILVDGELWATSYPGGELAEINPVTGAVVQSISVGERVPHFASPSAAAGLLLIGTTGGIVAFAGPSGPDAG